MQRTLGSAPRLLDVALDEIGDAVHERVGQPLLDRPLAPGEIGLLLLLAMPAVTLGEREQPLGGVRAPVEHHVLATRAQLGIEVVVDRDLPGVDDAHVHAGLDGVIEEHRVHGLAHRLVAAERERQVGYAAGDVNVRQVRPDPARRLDEGDTVTVVLLHPGGDGENVGIEDDVLGREAHLSDQNVVGALGDRALALQRVGLALLVEGHDHHGGAVAAHDLGMFDERRLALLHRDRIHHRLALQALEPRLDHREFRRVDHHRHARDVGLGRDQVEEGRHRLLGIEQALVHVDVDDLRAVLHLVAGDGQRRCVVARGDELAELGRAGDVGALAHVDERDFRREREGLETGQAQQPRHLRNLPRRLALHRAHDGVDVLGRGATAAADHVDQAGIREFAEQRGHELRALVVAAELVGQTGIGIGADEGIGDARDLGDMGAHFSRPQRAVQSDRERRGVAHRAPERRRRLAGEQPPRAIGDGAGDHHRHAHAAHLGDVGDGRDRRLGIERVENRFDQQQVGAALEQPFDLLGISGAQFVEGDRAKAGIGDVGRDRGGAIGRPDRARHEARTAVLVLREIGRGAGELGALDIELMGNIRHAVVGLGDARRGEGVGGDDIGARAEIREVNVADLGRLAEDEQIVVAAHLAVPGIEARAPIAFLVEPERLDHGAHGAVEHQDTLGGDAAERLLGAGHGYRHGNRLRCAPSPRRGEGWGEGVPIYED